MGNQSGDAGNQGRNLDIAVKMTYKTIEMINSKSEEKSKYQKMTTFVKI